MFGKDGFPRVSKDFQRLPRIAKLCQTLPNVARHGFLRISPDSGTHFPPLIFIFRYTCQKDAPRSISPLRVRMKGVWTPGASFDVVFGVFRSRNRALILTLEAKRRGSDHEAPKIDRQAPNRDLQPPRRSPQCSLQPGMFQPGCAFSRFLHGFLKPLPFARTDRIRNRISVGLTFRDRMSES